jgi:methionine synthase II (cobalamin-independent)
MSIADMLSFDLTLPFDKDQVGELLDQGTTMLFGVVDTAPRDVPSVQFVGEAAARRVQNVLDRWGFDVSAVGERISLTPTCGLAHASPAWTRTAYAALEDAGRVLREERRGHDARPA